MSSLKTSIVLIWVGNISHGCIPMYTVFLQSDAAVTIYFAARFVRLLFKGSIYFFGKAEDINDGWIGYVSETVTVDRRYQ